MFCGIVLLLNYVQDCKVSAIDEPIRAKYQLKTGHHPIGSHLTSRSAESHFGSKHNLVGVSKQRGVDVHLVFGGFKVIKVIQPDRGYERLFSDYFTCDPRRERDYHLLYPAGLSGVLIYSTFQIVGSLKLAEDQIWGEKTVSLGPAKYKRYSDECQLERFIRCDNQRIHPNCEMNTDVTQ